MFIFAHRGLKLEYPENTLSAFKAAADLGFGIELDVRLTKDDKLVCSHDPINDVLASQLTRFEDVAKNVISAFGPNQKAAIHVKADEQGNVQLGLLNAIFKKYDLYKKAFLFDLTLETAEKMKRLNPTIEVAVSIGEENYSPTIYTWEQAKARLDAFDSVLWDEWKVLGSVYNQAMREEIGKAGKPIYTISPELHADHGNPHAASGYEQEWQNFIKWSIEGVCTAYPRELKTLLQEQRF